MKEIIEEYGQLVISIIAAAGIIGIFTALVSRPDGIVARYISLLFR